MWLLSPVSICDSLTTNPPFWDSRIHISPLPCLCKSVSSPGKGRHRDLQLCKWCNWCDHVFPAQPPCWWHWSLLGQEGLNIYPKYCWGTWRSYIPQRSCFPGPILSSFPSSEGTFGEKQTSHKTLGALQQCHIPLIAPHTIFRFAFQTGEISVGWDIPLQKQVEKT